MTTERIAPVKDKTWLALMESLAALTTMLRFASGENIVSNDEAMTISASAIKKITEAFSEFNI